MKALPSRNVQRQDALMQTHAAIQEEQATRVKLCPCPTCGASSTHDQASHHWAMECAS